MCHRFTSSLNGATLIENRAEVKMHLDELRCNIDAIDHQIIDLLKERIDLVHQVGVLKQTSGGTPSFIRADREARMVRDLVGRIEGAYPAEVIVQIWRVIITASLAAEHPFAVGVLTGDEDLGAVSAYFPTITLQQCDSVETLWHRLHEGSLSVGVVSAAEHRADWVQYCAQDQDDHPVRVCAAIPFTTYPPQFFVLARALPDSTGDDSVLWSVDGYLYLCDEGQIPDNGTLIGRIANALRPNIDARINNDAINS